MDINFLVTVALMLPDHKRYLFGNDMNILHLLPPIILPQEPGNEWSDIAELYPDVFSGRHSHCLLRLLAYKGNKKMIKSSLKKGYNLDNDSISAAAEGGHFELMQWLYRRGCILTEKTMAGAASSGNIDILIWLRKKKCPWNEEACTCAAYNGQLDALKWLRSQNPRCPWSPFTCSAAVIGGHLDVLEWAHQNGCPLDIITFRFNNRWLQKSKNPIHQQIHEYLIANKCPQK